MKQPQLTIYSREIIPIVFQFGAQGYGVVRALIDIMEAASVERLPYRPHTLYLQTGAENREVLEDIIQAACNSGIFNLTEDNLTCPFMQPWWEYRKQLSQQRSEYGSRKGQAQPEPIKTETKNETSEIPNPKLGAHLFENSPYSVLNEFVARFKGTEYEQYDLPYYFESVRDWSKAGGKMKKDWIATARTFIRSDVERGKAKRAKVDAPFRHQQNRSTVDAFREASR